MLLLLDDIAMNIMGVIMVVCVDGQVVGDLAAEELEIGRVPRHALGVTGAADMPVETEHRALAAKRKTFRSRGARLPTE